MREMCRQCRGHDFGVPEPELAGQLVEEIFSFYWVFHLVGGGREC